jgi:HK97 family phage portal protein
MGVKEFLFGKKSAPVPALISYETINPNPLITITSMGTEVVINLQELMWADAAALYRTQPYLRAVVSFLGRNIGQLGIGTFLREGDEVRTRDEESVTAQLLRSPNPYMTRYELINALVCDMALWDMAYWLVTVDAGRVPGWRITHIPAVWVQQPYGGDVFEPEYWFVNQPGKPTQRIPASRMIHFHGWDPTFPAQGTSPVYTLKAILMEQVAAVIYRQQRWERGARVGTVISRPVGAPQWSPQAEERFREEWRNSFAGRNGTDAGGTPILQDGMTLTKVGFSAVEDEFVNAAKLALTTVASVYHVNPTMLGLLDNANYSNVREFRRMLYGDTLGPWFTLIETRLNGFLLPMIGAPANQYIEFNINEKLQGSFEEQAAVASMAVGGPYMTRNEYRARQNLAPIDGGDELIVPMNVTTGGQPSPVTPLSQLPLRLSGPKPTARAQPPARTRTGPYRAKLRASDNQQKRTEQVLRRFYERQGRVVLTNLGTKSNDDWWDEQRWDDELATDLTAISKQVSNELGNQMLNDLGMPDPYDLESTVDFLRAVMETRASSMNATTKAAVEDALANADDPEAITPSDVFVDAADNRSVTGAATLMTTVAGIAMSESGKQAEAQSGKTASKTWVVTSSNSRHPEMDGETVGLDENFSNGAAWPGDAVLGPDETSGCTCDLVISMS